MATSPTAFLAIDLPVPGSAEPFLVSAYVDAITALDAEAQAADTAISLLDGRLDTAETDIVALETITTTYDALRPTTGGIAFYKVADLTALDAVSTAEIGDRASMTTPGTGINQLRWEAHAGSGATIDWRVDEPVVAATKANLDSFISAVAAISDTTFEVGGLAYVTGTGELYRFNSAAGGLSPASGARIIPSAATNGSVSAAGVVTSTAQALVRVRDCFPVGFTVFRVVFDVTMSGASGPQIQLAVAAVDAATAYDRESHAAVAAASVPQQSLNAANGALSPINVAGARHFGFFYITNANIAGPTYLDAHTVVAVPTAMTASTGRCESGVMHRTSTVYDSFTLTGSAGNVTVNHLTIEGIS